MKIIHLTFTNEGGAGIAASRFNELLLRSGHQSIMIVRHKIEEDEGIIKFRIRKGFFFKKFRVPKIKSKKYKLDPRYCFFNIREDFHFKTKKFIKQLPFVPDIIFVHWISGFANSKNLYELQQITGAPIIWRFNDMSAFTGGCHYSNGCTNYQTTCGHCPALYSKKLKDRSYKNLKEKIKWLSKTDITFVSSTTEIDDQLRSSAIAKHCKTKKILIGCNNNFFNYENKKEAYRKELQLPIDKKIILFGAKDIMNKRKGLDYLLKALYYLKETINEEEAKSIVLVYIGGCSSIKEILFPFQIIYVDYINGEESLAKMYKASTCFVSPSIEDAGPMMVCEAMLCGTPVVAFNIGIAKDAITDSVNSFSVPLKDTQAFAFSIKKIIQMNENEYEIISKQCSSFAQQTLSVKREIKDYENLMDNLTKQSKRNV